MAGRVGNLNNFGDDFEGDFEDRCDAESIGLANGAELAVGRRIKSMI